MVFNRLKTSTRIYAGFASLIVLGAFVAIIGSWGIDGLAQQNRRMNALSGNLRYVTTALQGVQRMTRILLRVRFEPADELKSRYHEALDKARDALNQAKAHSLSAERRAIDQSVLDKLDLQAQSADKSLELGRVMIEGRGKLMAGGDALTAATERLVELAKQSGGETDNLAVAKAERDIVFVRSSSWRFLANVNKDGPAQFRKSLAAANESIDALQLIPQLATAATAIRPLLAAYAQAFDTNSSAQLALDDAFRSVQRPLSEAIEAELVKAEQSLTQDTDAATEASAELASSTSEIQMVVAGLGLVIGVLLAFFISRGIVRPLTGMTNTMATLAAGNHDVAIPGAERTDEIGGMARAVEVFKTNMIEAERLAAEQEAARAARSRRQDAMDNHTRAFGNSVTNVMAALGNAAGNMSKAADIMTEAAAAVHQEASETAGGAGKSSADLTAVAAAVEQFTASVGEISRQVAVAADVATQAVQRAESSQATIRGLADSTARIGDVVRLIDTIASQTNLLALNATIEAARAGDAGKGFAVVAGEVKALASQTAKATAEISAQIETVRSATEDTVNAMNEIGSIIGRMGEVSTAISAAVEEQSVTTREIASSIQGVAGSTAQAANAMGHVVEVADRAGEASRNILTEAAEIGSESDRLRQQVESFLKAVQADSGERRRFERIAGHGLSATLLVAGTTPVKAVVHDLSRGGISLRHRGNVSVGQDIQIDMPEAGGPVAGRVIRVADGLVAVSFNENPAMLVRVDRVLANLAAARVAA